MSNVHEFEDETGDEAPKDPVRARMRQLEKELKAKEQALAEADAIRRENAFMKAGIPMDNPMAKYFVKGYDGNLDPEAIRQAAVEARLISPPDTTPTADEAQAWQRTNKIAAGAQTAQPPVDWSRRLNEARNPQEVEAILAEARIALGNANY